ncbi:hypothetical protein NQ317_011840 [Molorchus minor]|uniref:Spaetzle domain-containing protein n=1 Tax=Molorchus minor TaxID=1323400 RepID=A0ABQ9JTP8_9CUCU|nr:hypothetical protein NQ317_011840 [Molorchus minor]
MFQILWILIANVFIGCHPLCSSLYGSEPCSFLPAPPGKTPSCARPGLTYCEQPDHYPGQLIHYLIQKWRYDHTTLLSSESRDEFSAYYSPPPNTVYGPPNYQSFGPNNVAPPSEGGYYPEPIYIPKPQYQFPENRGAYIPPKTSQNYTANFGGYPERKNEYQGRGPLLNFKYNNDIPQSRPFYDQPLPPQNYYDFGPQQYSNNIWKRRVENNYKRLKRSLRYRRSQQTLMKVIESGTYSNTSLARDRDKRQSLGNQVLCQIRSRYIVPKAALNNKGNWMYVVNMPEVDSRYTQLVKSETCV